MNIDHVERRHINMMVDSSRHGLLRVMLAIRMLHEGRESLNRFSELLILGFKLNLTRLF